MTYVENLNNRDDIASDILNFVCNIYIYISKNIKNVKYEIKVDQEIVVLPAGFIPIDGSHHPEQG